MHTVNVFSPLPFSLRAQFSEGAEENATSESEDSPHHFIFPRKERCNSMTIQNSPRASKPGDFVGLLAF